MLDGLQGETVTAHPVSFGGSDAYGNAVKTKLDPVEVADVLVAPDEAASAIEDGRPHGATVGVALYMRDPGIDWRGASVDVRGRAYDVQGDPVPYDPRLVPTERNLCVRAVRNEG